LGLQDDQLERLYAGDANACEQFVRTHAVELFGWLYRLIGCREEAEDLAQEAFAAFWESIRRKKPPVEARVWLFSIARNLWRQHCRRSAARPDVESIDALQAATTPHDSGPEIVERDESAQMLDAAVAALEPELREVVSLRMWHNLSYDQIAAIQNIKSGLARWRFFHARELLRKQLGPWFHGD
jgi:RNA polymerase sigma-70 factor, ECF subfamily